MTAEPSLGCRLRVVVTALIAVVLTTSLLVGSCSAVDTLRPEISAWGIEGNPQVASFRAWANVSDPQSGVRNVTLFVERRGVSLHNYSMQFNGSLYVTEVPRLEANSTYALYVMAFDMANNSATSYRINIDTHVPPEIPDLTVTEPWVVGSSLVLALATIAVTYVYDRRRRS